jgi:hypothetical protein
MSQKKRKTDTPSNDEEAFIIIRVSKNLHCISPLYVTRKEANYYIRTKRFEEILADVNFDNIDINDVVACAADARRDENWSTDVENVSKAFKQILYSPWLRRIKPGEQVNGPLFLIEELPLDE